MPEELPWNREHLTCLAVTGRKQSLRLQESFSAPPERGEAELMLLNFHIFRHKQQEPKTSQGIVSERGGQQRKRTENLLLGQKYIS